MKYVPEILKTLAWFRRVPVYPKALAHPAFFPLRNVSP